MLTCAVAGGGWAFSEEHPELEQFLKLLYIGMTRAQRRLNFIETGPSRAASVFLSPRATKQGVYGAVEGGQYHL